VLVVMGLVMTFMVVKVLPQVGVLYEGIGGANQLPLITRILLAFSNFVIKRWYVAIALFVAIGFFTGKWIRTVGGRSIADRLKMSVPPIGPLFMKVYMARFSRTGTTLVASGVPLLQMLDITAGSINNVHVEKSIRTAIEKVKGGKSLSESIAGDTNFLDLVPDMLHIGEQSGQIEQMMEKTADYYEKEVDTQIKTVSTIIEPVLMVILGVVAFIIVAAVLLPIYGLAGKNIGG
jgi:type IV pilus assembly protein PilC